MNLPEITDGNWKHEREPNGITWSVWASLDVSVLEAETEADAKAAAALPALLSQLEECRAFIDALTDCTELEALWDLVANNAETVEDRAREVLIQAGCTE